MAYVRVPAAQQQQPQQQYPHLLLLQQRQVLLRAPQQQQQLSGVGAAPGQGVGGTAGRGFSPRGFPMVSVA
jgi:hypothetical protein